MACVRIHRGTLMNLLAMESSTDFFSVGASRGAELVSRHEPAGRRQAERILDMVGEVLAEARLEIAHKPGIAYGAGPGSFTCIRIPAGVTQGFDQSTVRVRGGAGSMHSMPR